MKPSSPLGLKAWASKLHPPLPLSPQDSQKLLSLLTSSFRANLDREHAGSSASTPQPLPIDAHLHEVLSSPLLRKVSASTDKDMDTVNGISRVQSLLSDPMGYFQEQVAVGQATLDIAKLCLHAQRKASMSLKEKQAADLFQAPTAASMTLKWLWSSGLEASLEFVHHTGFLKSLIPLMLEEGKTKYVWKWFDSLHQRVDSSPRSSKFHGSETLDAMANLLKTLIWARMRKDPSDFNIVMKDIANAQTRLGASTIKTMSRALRPALALFSARLLIQPSTELDSRLYGNFVQIGHLGDPVEARLALLSPTPDPTVALRYIKSRLIVRNDSPFFRELCIRTTEVLIAQRDTKQANWMISYVQEHFPAEFGRLRISKNALGGRPSLESPVSARLAIA